MDRRRWLQTLGAAPAVALAFTWTPQDAAAAAESAARARQAAATSGEPYTPRFFTAHEFATVVALADMILPRDERSGSASDAGAPEFIDHIASVDESRQVRLRGGLAWLDAESLRRFERVFLASSDAERRALLDDIAYPARARPELHHGVVFFTTMRDLVATGFWTSRIGVDDLGYIGNRPVGEWTGAPDNVLRKLGVSYD